MKKLLVNLTLALSLAFAAAGCGGNDNACDTLVKKICDGKGDDYCKKTKAWLEKEFVGPDGEKMSSKETGMACQMIADDKEALAAYRNQAKRELSGQN
jgi:hypothetical protein